MNIRCAKCEKVIRILDWTKEAEFLLGKESDLWQNYPCPTCERPCKSVPYIEIRSTDDVIDLTPKEAFIAFSGVGLPEERKFTNKSIEEMLKTPVRKVVGRSAETGKYILEHLELWDGTKVYFGASPQGAVIYRVASPPNYSNAR